MARKNVVPVSTNVTPDQHEAIEHVRQAMDNIDMSRLVRIALAQLVERNGVKWPVAEIKRGAKAAPPILVGLKD